MFIVNAKVCKTRVQFYASFISKCKGSGFCSLTVSPCPSEGVNFPTSVTLTTAIQKCVYFHPCYCTAVAKMNRQFDK